LASKDELCSEEVVNVHAEDVGTVDKEADDEVASHCDDSDLLSIPAFIYWHVFCCMCSLATTMREK
jgi:hypothetical protein